MRASITYKVCKREAQIAGPFTYLEECQTLDEAQDRCFRMCGAMFPGKGMDYYVHVEEAPSLSLAAGRAT